MAACQDAKFNKKIPLLIPGLLVHTAYFKLSLYVD